MAAPGVKTGWPALRPARPCRARPGCA